MTPHTHMSSQAIHTYKIEYKYPDIGYAMRLTPHIFAVEEGVCGSCHCLYTYKNLVYRGYEADNLISFFREHFTKILKEEQEMIAENKKIAEEYQKNLKKSKK